MAPPGSATGRVKPITVKFCEHGPRSAIAGNCRGAKDKNDLVSLVVDVVY